jgi:protein SCO1/2
MVILIVIQLPNTGATQVVEYGKPSLGGPFVLVDHNGNPVTDATYRGQFTLMYFGFSHCPDICPSELVKVGKVLKELGEFYGHYVLQTSNQDYF